MQGIPTAGRNPFIVFFWLVSVLVVCFGFLLFGSFLVCVVFDGIAHWTLYWSTTSSFEAADLIDGLASTYNSACLLRLNVCNDLAKAMKALDGKKGKTIVIITNVTRLNHLDWGLLGLNANQKHVESHQSCHLQCALLCTVSTADQIAVPVAALVEPVGLVPDCWSSPQPDQSEQNAQHSNSPWHRVQERHIDSRPSGLLSLFLCHVQCSVCLSLCPCCAVIVLGLAIFAIAFPRAFRPFLLSLLFFSSDLALRLSPDSERSGKIACKKYETLCLQNENGGEKDLG